MIEILWHGRGGQGAFTAARLLGAAASLAEGRYALAFPSFGPERRGAPMRAFTKIDDAQIGDRSAIEHADYVIYLDETLLTDGWDLELKPAERDSEEPHVLVNSAAQFDDPRIVALDANGLSSEVFGRPIPNTVFLGALSCLIEGLSGDDVKEAIRSYMPVKLHEGNERIVDEVRDLVARDGSGFSAPTRKRPRHAAHTEGARMLGDLEYDEAAALVRAAMMHGADERRIDWVPTLREGSLPAPACYARTTCFEAGHLVSRNAGWRNVRPVVDESKCTGCLVCYKHCPDGTIFKVNGPVTAGGEGSKGRPKIAIDYDFCKGCGICERACKFGALHMIPESAALAIEAEANAAEERKLTGGRHARREAPAASSGPAMSETEVMR